jgi:hypothetical protein
MNNQWIHRPKRGEMKEVVALNHARLIAAPEWQIARTGTGKKDGIQKIKRSLSFIFMIPV